MSFRDRGSHLVRRVLKNCFFFFFQGAAETHGVRGKAEAALTRSQCSNQENSSAEQIALAGR